MSSLVWSDALTLSMPMMDDIHREFVDLLAEVQASDDDTLRSHWQTLIDHTDDHFGREDRWMEATGFAPGSCHMTQHAVVLKVLREGAALGAQGNLAPIRQMAHELTIWFPQHTASMDAGLALHMNSLGYDPVTGELARPESLPEQPIAGCGGACGGDGHGKSATESPTAQAEATAHI